MRHLVFLFGTWLLCSSALPANAQQKYVELIAEGTAYQGKVVGRNDQKVWLVQRDGRMHTLELKKIETFRKLADDFSPLSAGDVRDELRRELGPGMDIIGTGHYLVAGPSSLVSDYAQLFEDQYRAVYSYFSVRGFEIHTPEFPLIAIIFPDAKSFAKYAAKDKVEAKGGLKGYYVQSTNRIALFRDAVADGSSRITPEKTFPYLDQAHSSMRSDLKLPPWIKPSDQPVNDVWANISETLEGTLIHESTHQVAFNIGIHSRVGQTNPRWVVEGLATVFEAPGMRSSSLAMTPGAKLNLMRLSHFQEFVKSRRQPKSLANFIQSDLAFGSQVLDGYAQAWALTYFLVETRPREYSRLLHLIAARPDVEEYDDKQRLSDFQQAFGSDLVLLEAKFLRFMDEVVPPPSHVSQRPKKIRTLDDLRRNGINPIDKSQLVPLPPVKSP